MKPYLTMEEIISIPRLSEPAVSEDGCKVAWVETITDWDKNEYPEHVQVYDTRTETKITLEAGSASSNSPAWSTTNRLAWLGLRDGLGQVFVLAEGKPIQVTSIKTGVISFQWAPDGEGIYFIAPDLKCQEALEKRKELYGDFSYAERDRTWNSLYFTKIGPDEDLIKTNSTPKDLRPQDQEPERKLLGDEKHHVLGFAVSPDSTSIATIAAPGSDVEAKEDAKVYLFDMATSELKELPVPKPLDNSG
ncbi:MAG TPA: hypothetical protein PLV34_05555, partial [Bacillota bacterium]|nr:hypothetical protein [Bacillota bacterium]